MNEDTPIIGDKRRVLVSRSLSHSHVGNVKTEYSREFMPLAPALAEVVLEHGKRCVETPEGWLFANPLTGKPYLPDQIQKKHIRPAGIRAGVPGVGWHTFRHSYRSWLDETGAPVKVQQELMRHADVQTTMNIYGRAAEQSKRQANEKVVVLALPAKQRVEETGVSGVSGSLPRITDKA